MSDYVITNGELYVHYNPQAHQYFLSNQLLGAAVFTRENGTNFYKTCLDSSFHLQLINSEKPKITVSRDKEIDLYRQTHS